MCYPFFTFYYKTDLYSIWRSHSSSRSLFLGYLKGLSRNIGQFIVQERRLLLFALPVAGHTHSQPQSSSSLCTTAPFTLRWEKASHLLCPRPASTAQQQPPSRRCHLHSPAVQEKVVTRAFNI